MNEFINRKGVSLDRRSFEVEKVETDEAGEITRIIGTLVRADNSTIAGTEIEANVFNKILQEAEMTEQEIVMADKVTLKLSDSVSANFTLPQTGANGSSITWKVTSGTGISIVGSTAVVTKEFENQSVKLTATITYGTASDTKVFTITAVKRLTDQQKVEADIASISLSSQVTSSFTLPQTGANGSKIVWSTLKKSTPITISKSIAVVTSRSKDEKVDLQAEFTCGTYKTYKNYSVTILGSTVKITPDSLTTSWTQEKGTLKSNTFVVSALKEKNIYVEVEANSNLSVQVLNNNTTDVSIIVSETQALNNQIGTTMILEFNVKVYTTEEPGILIKKIPGTIKYTFASTASSN